MMSRQLSRALTLTLWLVTDISFFRMSREGFANYLFMLFGIPALVGLVLIAVWRADRKLILLKREVVWIGVCSKLISFHWYVIPFVYGFEQRDEWILEIWHQVITLTCQVSVLLLLRYLLVVRWGRVPIAASRSKGE